MHRGGGGGGGGGSSDPSSPEDYHHDSGDNLSNFGSERGKGWVTGNGLSTSARPNGSRHRRLSTPTLRDHLFPIKGASNGASRALATGRTRDFSARAQADAREAGSGGIRPKQQGRRGGEPNNSNNNAGNDLDRPAWNTSTRPVGNDSKGVAAGQSHGGGEQSFFATGTTAGGAGSAEEDANRSLVAQNSNRRSKAKRSCVGNTTSSGWCAADSTRDDINHIADRDGEGGGGVVSSRQQHQEQQHQEEELDSVAPSQEEIRVMIERIRLQTAADDTGGRRGTGGNGVGRIEQESAAVAVTTTTTAPRHTASSSAVARGINGGGGGGGGGTASRGENGGLGMVEIEEEERRLKEQASKLQLEMSALKRRRLEVRLVKVEQKLKEEAAARLVQREARVRAAVERACEALRRERTERINGVAAVKEDLRSKLEQLSSMHEEVSARLETLEQAYDNAEEELKERAHADQEQAVQRENLGVRRRIKTILLEHGPERSAERLAARQQEQRAAVNGTAAATTTTTTKDNSNKDRFANQSADQSYTIDRAPTSSTAVPAKLSSATATAINLTRGRAKAPISGTGAELPQERSQSAAKNKQDRPRRRSVGGTVRSAGAPRRKRRTSVDGAMPSALLLGNMRAGAEEGTARCV